MNYKKVQEHLAKKEKAVKNVMDFFTNEITYEEFMEQLALVQTETIKMINMVAVSRRGDLPILDPFAILFDSIQFLLAEMKPLIDIAKEEAEHEDVL